MAFPINELNEVRYATFPEITEKIRTLSDKYGYLPTGNIINAFGTIGFDMFTNDPYIQNRRVKNIGSSANKYTKPQVENMLEDVSNHEVQLREVEKQLEYTSYPLFHARVVYQNLLTYHSYVAPYLTNKGESKNDDFWREWKLLEKLRTEFKIKSVTHEITGQALQEGKVFYYPRYSVDKAHNKVNHAFLQQLPSDYVKIVGFNNKSKYTLAFNMMYFATQEGTCVTQFGDLFLPYLEEFDGAINPPPKGVGNKLIYASNSSIKLSKVTSDNIEAYYQNGKWYYWVILPIDKVFTFEVDDVIRDVVPPFTGLLLDMLQLSQLEALQLELLSNPLIAILTGEIPYFETKDTNIADQYKLSNAGRMLFESLWYQMTARTNTGGIGLYSAPFKNMKLETLPEAPNATNIVSSGYKDVMNKAGLSGIIPTSDDTRAGLAQISLQIESQFPKTVYRCMEQMMNVIIENLNLKYDWRFYMFGDVATDADVREETKKDMQMGILPAAIIYNAIYDRSIIEDYAWSEAIYDSGLLDKRIPLVTSYTMSPEAGIPPVDKKAGRPQEDGTTSEGAEADFDQEARLNV